MRILRWFNKLNILGKLALVLVVLIVVNFIVSSIRPAQILPQVVVYPSGLTQTAEDSFEYEQDQVWKDPSGKYHYYYVQEIPSPVLLQQLATELKTTPENIELVENFKRLEKDILNEPLKDARPPDTQFD